MRFHFHKFFVFLLLITASKALLGQEKLEVYENNKLIISESFKDSVSKSIYLQNVNLKYISKGYIEFKLDTLENRDDFLKLFLYKGPQYNWDKLSLGKNLQSENFSFSESGKVFNSNSLIDGIDKQLRFYEDNGYPFARVYFDSLRITKERISGKLMSNLGDYFSIDSIVIKGGSKTSKQFILRHIGINKGQTYNESLIRKIDSKLQNIPFIEIIRGSEVFFTKGKATLVLYVKDKSASRFDGILGINPDENTGKITVVGDVKVNLLNAFKRGEKVLLNFESIKANTQNYAFEVDYPFLFGSRVGLITSINYFRQDTTFANLNLKGGFSFFLENQQRISVFANVIQSNSLLSQSSNSNEFQSLQTIYLGVIYELTNLDYRLNPRKGWSAQIELNSGNKTIGSSTGSNDDETNMSSFQIKSDVKASYFIPLFKKSTIKFGVQSGNIFGETIYDNELYQIGGLNTLRGFNQQSFLVSNYAIVTSEFRYLFDRNSAVFGFVDASFYEKKSIDEFVTDTPFGFGAGVNFQTGAGIFTLTYGLGKQLGNPILIKNGKVHFGFVSLF
jgi:outer membrane protein assembly factor BamA